MKRLQDRLLLYLMAGLSAAALACYTLVWRLCRLEAREPCPQRAAQRRQLANVAHTLDWLVSIVAAAAVKRLYREEDFGGQHQPRWLKVYFMITGPLPTVGMVVAMVTGHRWGETMQQNAGQRQLHRAAAILGYVAWWFSVLPIFAQPWLNRQREAQAKEASKLEL